MTKQEIIVLMVEAFEDVAHDRDRHYCMSDGPSARVAIIQRDLCRALAEKLRELGLASDEEVT